MNFKKIYEKIPKVTGCKKGCTECCGPVPCTKQEFDAILDIPEKFAPVCDEQGNRFPVCRFKSDDGCLVYEDRPIICRLLGAVNDVGMACPYGATSVRLLSSRAAGRLIQRVGKEGLVIL